MATTSMFAKIRKLGTSQHALCYCVPVANVVTARRMPPPRRTCTYIHNFLSLEGHDGRKLGPKCARKRNLMNNSKCDQLRPTFTPHSRNSSIRGRQRLVVTGHDIPLEKMPCMFKACYQHFQACLPGTCMKHACVMHVSCTVYNMHMTTMHVSGHHACYIHNM